MAAGKLRHRVTLQTLAQVEAGGSGLTQTYTDVATVWAGITTQRGQAKLDGEPLETVATHLFRIRHRSDVSRATFLSFDDRRFNVLEVRNPDERGRWLELLTTEAEDV